MYIYLNMAILKLIVDPKKIYFYAAIFYQIGSYLKMLKQAQNYYLTFLLVYIFIGKNLTKLTISLQLGDLKAK